MRSFWPAGEAAQADYETLRAAVLTGDGWTDNLAAARFRRRGLAGLIAWPSAEPVFVATLAGMPRPVWSPHADPRQGVLADAYGLLIDVWHKRCSDESFEPEEEQA